MKVIRCRTHYIVYPYQEGQCYELERSLSYYIRLYGRGRQGFYKPLGYVIDGDVLKFPAGVNPWFVSKMTGCEVTENPNFKEYGDISIRATGSPKDDWQAKMVRFLLGEEEYVENRNHAQLVCNAQTGEGKTFAAIVMMAYYKCKTAVILHMKDLRDNWIADMMKHSDISKTRICCLDTETMINIVHDKEDVSKYYVFLMLHQTIRSFVKHEGSWSALTKLFCKLKIGLKIIDEANMEFSNQIYIDCYTNVFKNVYLTATMKRSNRGEDKVFQTCFHEVPKFDPLKLGHNTAKKHIHMVAIIYNSHPSLGQVANCRRQGMFDVKRFADYQVLYDSRFFELLTDVIEKFTIKNGFRTAVFCGKINSCEIIADYLKSVFPEKKIGIYNSSIKPAEKKRVREKCDIIVTISKSLGMGVNIKDLRCVINTEAFRFDGIGDQMSGRLRAWFQGIVSWYVEFVDYGFVNVKSQYRDRLKLYMKVFSSVDEIRIQG